MFTISFIFVYVAWITSVYNSSRTYLIVIHSTMETLM